MLIDMTGQRFGRLIVKIRADNVGVGKKSKSAWLCHCDCGNELTVYANNLRRGNTQSCGCLHVDHIKPVSKGFGLAPDNAIILCRNCNSSKGNKDLNELPKEWAQKIVGASNTFSEIWASAGIIYNDARRRGL